MQDYNNKKAVFIKDLTDPIFKGLPFSEIDEKAKQVFRKVLLKERKARDNSFFQNKTLTLRKDYEQTDLFKVCKAMPKGGALHIHIDCCVDVDWFKKEMLTHSNTYFSEKDKWFKYFKDPKEAPEGYLNVVMEKAKKADLKAYEKLMEECLYLTDSEILDQSSNIWAAFEVKIYKVNDLFFFKDHALKYLIAVFNNFIDDGIYYLEARGCIGSLYDENHKPLSIE